MRPSFRLALTLLFLTPVLHAAQPPELSAALRSLGAQKSYSWEIINGDPGPVAQTYETRRGAVTTVQQNTSPHIKGSLAANGEALIRRDWPDGLQMDTFVAANGVTVTNTPEGWMTAQEVLDAMVAERAAHPGAPTERYLWLRRADRPDVRRPDEELSPFMRGGGAFTLVDGSYVAQFRVRSDGSIKTDDDDDGQPTLEVMIKLTVRNGAIGDYETKIEGAQSAARARLKISINESRLVVLSNSPVRRLDVPDEAREKAKAPKLR